VESFSSHQDCTSGGTAGNSTSNLNVSVPCQDTHCLHYGQPTLEHTESHHSSGVSSQLRSIRDDQQARYQQAGLIFSEHSAACDTLWLQVAPTVKLDSNEYIYLAEKALSLFGMAPAVWLLAQLHEIGALRLYSLPSKLKTSSILANRISSGPTESPTAVTEALQGLGSNSFDCKHSEAHNGRGAGKGETEHPYVADAGSLDVAHIVKLMGLSVDIAIVVVLSWAAQLAQLEEACIVIKAESVTFILGKYREYWAHEGWWHYLHCCPASPRVAPL